MKHLLLRLVIVRILSAEAAPYTTFRIPRSAWPWRPTGPSTARGREDGPSDETSRHPRLPNSEQSHLRTQRKNRQLQRPLRGLEGKHVIQRKLKTPTMLEIKQIIESTNHYLQMQLPPAGLLSTETALCIRLYGPRKSNQAPLIPSGSAQRNRWRSTTTTAMMMMLSIRYLLLSRNRSLDVHESDIRCYREIKMGG
jgi:hypothetical protein